MSVTFHVWVRTMRLAFPAMIAALVTLLVSVPRRAPAAPPAAERELVDKVNRSISQGVQFLRVSMRDGKDWEGDWKYSVADMQGGVTALATLALLNCGEKPDSREVGNALATMRTMDPKATYVVALMTMAFAEGRQVRDLPLIQKHVDWLLRAALRKGGRIVGWSYWMPGGKNGQLGPNGDSSNTQYALLGLYAGKQAGAKIPDQDWEDLFNLYIKRQTVQPDGTGSWSYTPEFDNASFTMTAAGVSGLVISGLGRAKSAQGLNPATGVAANCGRYPDDEAMARGLNFIGKYFTFERPRNGQSTFYNIYGIERVGRLSGRRVLGTIDWYREGCQYLIKEQRKNGGWSQEGNGAEDYDSSAVISTSFALLFLSKGRTPVLVSKLAWGEIKTEGRGVFAEVGPEPGVVGWNRKHHDMRHLTEFASRELFNGLPMGWQVYDPRRRDLATKDDVNQELGVLLQSPVLFISGHTAPRLSGQQEELLKRYVEEGGFVFAEACCGAPEFTEGFRALALKLFPETPLRPLPPEHAIWQSYFAVPPTDFPKLECMNKGCRTVMVLSPEPLAGYWDEAKYMPKPGKGGEVDRGGEAYRLGANVIAYATGLEPPQQRLTVRQVASENKSDLSPPNGFLKPAQLKLLNEPAPAPAAMRNLMAHARTAAKLDVVLAPELVTADNPELFKFKFLYLHGRKAFTFAPAEQEGLRATLQSGGLLLADAACGSPAFDKAFREEIAKVIPGAKLVPIPLDDPLFSAELTGDEIRSVKRREKAGGSGPDSGFQELPPLLEGVKIDGRWAVIYSKYDLGCSLEGHRSTDCLGHTRESALRLATAALVYMLKR